MFELLHVAEAEELSARAEPCHVRMRDGVRLATDVYLPDHPSRHPAILVRTPYDKCSRYTALKFQADYYTAQGYVFVVQDVRGKFRSEGETVPYYHDVADAYDTIEWIVAQPWSNGRVGLTGDSYYGFTAWAGVACGHAAVRAAIPKVTGVNMGASHVASCWRQDVPNLLGLNDLIQIWTDRRGYLVSLDYAAGHPLELAEIARSKLGVSSGVEHLKRWATGNGDWFSPYGARHPYHTTHVPILHWVSWYDPGLAPAGMADWRALRSNPSTRHLHFLRAASADHGGFLLDDVDGGDSLNPYLDDAAMHRKLARETAEEMAFFDVHLKGIAPVLPQARVRWHLGHAGWRESQDWGEGLQWQTQIYYLDRRAGGAGSLALTRPVGTGTAAWVHDPANPVTSTSSIEEAWYFLAAYPDERGQASRDDVLTFTSEALASPADVAGQPVVNLVMETTAAAGHLFVKLQDVFPDGTTRQVSRGQMVFSGGRSGQVSLRLNDVAYRFGEGHRIQLQMQSSDYPHFLVHPGTNENPWLAKTLLRSAQRVVIGGSAAASLSLPIYAPL